MINGRKSERGYDETTEFFIKLAIKRGGEATPTQVQTRLLDCNFLENSLAVEYPLPIGFPERAQVTREEIKSSYPLAIRTIERYLRQLYNKRVLDRKRSNQNNESIDKVWTYVYSLRKRGKS